MKLPSLIGLAGTFGSGKDTLAEILTSEYGYTHVSTGDMVRQVAMERYGSIERPVLYRTAQENREKYGAGYFVELALKKSRPLIISGIRSLGEMKALKVAGGVMIYVDAPIELRHQRIVSRKRDNEVKLSLEEFQAFEETEMYAGDKDTDFNIRAIGERADVMLINDGSLEEFKQQLDQLAV